MRFTLTATMLALTLSAVFADAQAGQSPIPAIQTQPMQSPMPQNTSPTPMGMMMKPPTNLIEAELSHITSGTSIEPTSTPISMYMTHRAGWMLMLHGSAFISDNQQHAASNSSSLPFTTCPQFDIA